ncbi:MAG: hypothetical protein ACP5QE_07570 [Conexivisphaera sp.]
MKPPRPGILLALALTGNVMDFALTYYFVLLSCDAVELSPLVGAFSFLGTDAVPAAVFTAFVIYSLLALAGYGYAGSRRVRERLTWRRHCVVHPWMCGDWAFTAPLLALAVLKWAVVVSNVLMSVRILL